MHPFSGVGHEPHNFEEAMIGRREGNKEYRKNLERNYESQVFSVVFRGVQDPNYHPERMPKLTSQGEESLSSYMIKANSSTPNIPPPNRQNIHRHDLTAALQRGGREKRNEKVQKTSVKKESEETKSYPKSPRTSGEADPEILKSFRRDREVMKASYNKGMKPFVRPEKSLTEMGLI